LGDGVFGRLPSRIATLCWVELRKIRHDRQELYTRAIQPALWLLIYGETFTRIHAIPTPPGISYLSYLAPGILAQSARFIAIFYGIQIIWERDAGVLAKLMVTPTPWSALITGKAFAAGVRSLIQGVVVVVLSAILGVSLTGNPLRLLGAAAILVLGSGFFSCLSMTIAGIAVQRDRLMGIGQAITMPLFFSSSALYPARVMPGWLQAISKVNPLTYEVEALRGLLIGTSTNLWQDTIVLVVALLAGITTSSMLLARLASRLRLAAGYGRIRYTPPQLGLLAARNGGRRTQKNCPTRGWSGKKCDGAAAQPPRTGAPRGEQTTRGRGHRVARRRRIESQYKLD
jgi:ABC-2 type transport system permease protein